MVVITDHSGRFVIIHGGRVLELDFASEQEAWEWADINVDDQVFDGPNRVSPALRYRPHPLAESAGPSGAAAPDRPSGPWEPPAVYNRSWASGRGFRIEIDAPQDRRLVGWGAHVRLDGSLCRVRAVEYAGTIGRDDWSPGDRIAVILSVV